MAGPLTHLRRLVRDGRSDAPGRVVDVLGRVGLVGYGLVHLLVAWLALQVVPAASAASADPDGAIGTVARTPGGFASLTLGAVGLAAFAIWQLSAAAVGFSWVHGGERFRKRWARPRRRSPPPGSRSSSWTTCWASAAQAATPRPAACPASC